MGVRNSISAKTRKLVMQESGVKCAFCRNADVSALDFHHIQGRDIDDANEIHNLILVCANCHRKIHDGQYSEADVYTKKQEMKWEYIESQEKPSLGSTTVTNSGTINNSVIGNIHTLNIKTPRKPRINPPSGSIASDLHKHNYIKYLIDRYNDFGKIEKCESFIYSVIYSNIKLKFRAKWDMVPLGRFEELCTYLHRRIDNTMQGRKHKARGKPNYSDFYDYVRKYGTY